MARRGTRRSAAAVRVPPGGCRKTARTGLGSLVVTVVLWHIELSHYNEKARWALDYKSIAHELRVPMPGLHGARARVLTRGKHGRLPVIELEGRRIGDSTAIIAALEAYQPDPALYPADPAQKARALELEDFFDEQLAPQMRRSVWQHVLQDTDAIADSLFGDRAPGRARFLRATAPVVRPFVRRRLRRLGGVRRGRARRGPRRDGSHRGRAAAVGLHRRRRFLGGRPDRGSAVHAADRSAVPTVHAGDVPGRAAAACARSSRPVPAAAGSTRCTSATAGPASRRVAGLTRAR